jgi:hypothetical protein
MRRRTAAQRPIGARSLAKAGAAGYFQVAARIKFMNSDPDLEPLRARADFKKLVQELEHKATTRAK